MQGLKGPVVSYSTIRKLEASGITSLETVKQLKLDDLKKLGVPPRFAKQIVSYTAVAN
jgi:hypothetical protein